MITGAETAHLIPKHSPIFLEGRLAVADAEIVRELGLHEGQVVHATVQASAGRLFLNIAGQLIDLPRDLPPNLRLSAGDTLLFKVQVQSDGSVVLRPMHEPAAVTLAPAQSTGTWPDRNQQLELRPPDMGLLTQLLRPGVLENLAQQMASSSPVLGQLIEQWLRQRASMAQLTPEKLQRLFRRSGWMNESMTALGRSPEGIDLKTTLRQLLDAMQEQNADGVHLVKNALDDMEASQLLASETLNSREWVFSIMLPFRDAEPVALRFSRGRRQSGQDKPPVLIQLHTRSKDLGEIWLHTCISDQTEVDMVMWALREDIAARAKARATGLSEELENAGLHMKRLQIIHGPGPQDMGNWVPPDTGSMVDVRT